MLALTDAQSQKLFWLTQNGEWSLELRPADDAANSPESAETAWSLLLDGFSMTQIQALANAERTLTGKE